MEMGEVSRFTTFNEDRSRFVISEGSTNETDVGVYAIKIKITDSK